MSEMYVAVTLFVHEGKEAEFAAFEDKALSQLKEQGGEVVCRLRCAPRASGVSAPYEFHLLKLSSNAAFEAFFRSRSAYEPERTRLIAMMTVLKGANLSL